MIIIRYFQLCWLILLVILGYGPTPRRPKGDIRNFARSFFIDYTLHKYKEAGCKTYYTRQDY